MKTNQKGNVKACLFDLDGVVFDTEPQYTIFWSGISRQYHPEQPGLEQRIKGQTLDEILGNYFGDVAEEHASIVDRLNAFEGEMAFNYVAGCEELLANLRQKGIKTAVVTSSNQAKMDSVYRQHPQFKSQFDAILTSEDFDESKPSPDCYLKAAARFGVNPEDCIVFEDSFNGLKSGQASGAYVIGLTTSNSAEAIADLCNESMADYTTLKI